MQTLTFVCRQDFGTWIMHCYSWVGRYRDTAACVCVCVLQSVCCSGHTANAASRLVSAFCHDYDSPGTVLCVEAKLKGRFAQIWQLKKTCRHMHVCFREPHISSLLHFLPFYLQTNTILGEWSRGSLQTPSRVKRLQCWHVDNRKGKKRTFQHQGGRLHLIYLTWNRETCLSCLHDVIFCNDEDEPSIGALMQLSGLLLFVFMYTRQVWGRAVDS